MPIHSLALASGRREHRDEVHYRTQVHDAAGRAITIVVVNISPNGLMARCDTVLAVGSRLDLRLPDLGTIGAEVRWALGGRIGCEFEAPIPPASYYALLPRLL